jgi:hypothetical protein
MRPTSQRGGVGRAEEFRALMEEHELLAKATPIVQRVGSNLWQARSAATARADHRGGSHRGGPGAGGRAGGARPGARAQRV